MFDISKRGFVVPDMRVLTAVRKKERAYTLAFIFVYVIGSIFIAWDFMSKLWKAVEQRVVQYGD